jgi:hypothetical protein
MGARGNRGGRYLPPYPRCSRTIYGWDRPQDAKLDGQSWWPRSMSAFILATHDTFVSSSAHGHGRPAYHRSVPVHEREPNAPPGYPMGTRTRQSKSTNAAPYPTSPHHSGVRQPSSSGPITGTSSPYRALTASVFPKILLKISQILQAGLMYHIDSLTGHKSCHERRWERRNTTLLEGNSECHAGEGSSEPW